jgi:hypothetical protein
MKQWRVVSNKPEDPTKLIPEQKILLRFEEIQKKGGA